MADITRADLRVMRRPFPGANVQSPYPVNDEEFDRLVREAGFIRPNADGVADWLRHFGHKVRPGALRALLTDECDCEDGYLVVEVCGCGRPDHESHFEEREHADCGGCGWLLNRLAEDLCDTLADLVAYAPDVHDEFRRELIDWLEAEDEQ